MPTDDVNKRLETLEMTVEDLSGLPSQVAALDGRVESLELQFSQFREEVREEFSAVRKESQSEFKAARQEIKDESEQTRTEMRALHEEVLSRIKLLDEGRRRGKR